MSRMDLTAMPSGYVERDVPFLVWAAQRTVRMHCDTAPRSTGRCKACPDDDPSTCVAFRCAVRTLLDAGGVPYLYRFS